MQKKHYYVSKDRTWDTIIEKDIENTIESRPADIDSCYIDLFGAVIKQAMLDYASLSRSKTGEKRSAFESAKHYLFDENGLASKPYLSGFKINIDFIRREAIKMQEEFLLGMGSNKMIF